MAELTEMTAREIREGVVKGVFSAREVAEAHLRLIQEKDKR